MHSRVAQATFLGRTGWRQCLKEFIENDVPKPVVKDAANLDAWKKKVAKVRRILLEGVRDHIV